VIVAILWDDLLIAGDMPISLVIAGFLRKLLQ